MNKCPRPGDVVQHYKHDPDLNHHHVYEVVAIARPLPKRPSENAKMLRVIHTEDGSTLTLAFIAGSDYIGPAAVEWLEAHVIYQSIADKKVWARPLSKYLEPLEDGTPRFRTLSRSY